MTLESAGRWPVREESPDFTEQGAQRDFGQAGAGRPDGKCNRNKPPSLLGKGEMVR